MYPKDGSKLVDGGRESERECGGTVCEGGRELEKESNDTVRTSQRLFIEGATRSESRFSW